MRYILLSWVQLVALASLVAVMAAALMSINMTYSNLSLLPEVHVDGNGQCLKVVNFENGHVFNCNDVNVVLRRYRTVTPK